MNYYTFSFEGRKAGAIGIRSFYIEERQAENAKAALLKLYENYEHITVHKVTNKETGEEIQRSEWY